MVLSVSVSCVLVLPSVWVIFASRFNDAPSTVGAFTASWESIVLTTCVFVASELDDLPPPLHTSTVFSVLVVQIAVVEDLGIPVPKGYSASPGTR